jgi:hypothetical protein
MKLDESFMSNRVELYLQKAGLSLKGERAVARHTVVGNVKGVTLEGSQ